MRKKTIVKFVLLFVLLLLPGIAALKKAVRLQLEPTVYTATLTVVDNAGAVAKNSVDITVFPASPLMVVTISSDKISGTAPLKVKFSCVVSGGLPPYYYLWEFGDRKMSISTNPMHVFKAGNFVVKLTVTDSQGRVSSSAMTISVLSK